MTIQHFATNRALEHLARMVQEAPKRPSGQNNRELRHKLERGGYYFVDMAAYMAYYLGEVEADELPATALIIDSGTDVYKAFLEDPRVDQILVCVHGYNVRLDAAHSWFRILVSTLQNVPDIGYRIIGSSEDLKNVSQDTKCTAVIGFSWPADGKILSYASDQAEATKSAPALINLLARLRLTGKRLSVLCHSMGNLVLCHALSYALRTRIAPFAFTPEGYKLSKNMGEWEDVSDACARYMSLLERGELKDGSEEVSRKEFLLDTIVMLAPDVERRHVTKSQGVRGSSSEFVGEFYSGLQHLARRVVNVYSRFDTALAISTLEKRPRDLALRVTDRLDDLTLGLFDFLERNPQYKWEKRLGSAPHPESAPPNFKSLNATELAGRRIDHGDHIDAPDVLRAVAAEIGIPRFRHL